MPITLDGTEITGCTIDGADVQEITIDGIVAWVAYTPQIFIGASFNSDIYRYDENGNQVWAINAGLSMDSFEIYYDIAIWLAATYIKQFDGDGNENWFKTDIGEDDKRDISIDINNNAMLADYSGRMYKVDSSGSIIWNRIFDKLAVAISFDLNGDVYVGQVETFESTELEKYASDSGFLWEYTFSNDNGIVKLEVDTSNDAYVCQSNTLYKIDSSGNKVWEYSPANTVDATAIDNENNIYLAQSAGYMTKIDSAGSEIWHKSVSINGAIRDMDIAPNGNIYLVDDDHIRAFDSSLTSLWATPTSYTPSHICVTPGEIPQFASEW